MHCVDLLYKYNSTVIHTVKSQQIDLLSPKYIPLDVTANTSNYQYTSTTSVY
jgi:hypothetical protein